MNRKWAALLLAMLAALCGAAAMAEGESAETPGFIESTRVEFFVDGAGIEAKLHEEFDIREEEGMIIADADGGTMYFGAYAGDVMRATQDFKWTDWPDRQAKYCRGRDGDCGYLIAVFPGSADIYVAYVMDHFAMDIDDMRRVWSTFLSIGRIEPADGGN